MGAGNYTPRDPDAEYIYINRDYEDEDGDFWWDELTEAIWCCLPKSMTRVKGNAYHEDGKVIAINDHAIALLKDWESYAVLTITPEQGDDGRRGLHCHWVGQVSRKIFTKLHEAGYSLSVRKCAWTSAPFQP